MNALRGSLVLLLLVLSTAKSEGAVQGPANSRVCIEARYGEIPASAWKELGFEKVLDGASREQNPKLPPEVLGIWSRERCGDFHDALERHKVHPWQAPPRVTVVWGELARLMMTREVSYPPIYTADPDIVSHNRGVNAVDRVRVPATSATSSAMPLQEIAEMLECRATLVPRGAMEGRAKPLVELAVNRRQVPLGQGQKDEASGSVLKVVLENRQTLVLKRLPTAESRSKGSSSLDLVLVSLAVMDSQGRPAVSP